MWTPIFSNLTFSDSLNKAAMELSDDISNFLPEKSGLFHYFAGFTITVKCGNMEICISDGDILSTFQSAE